jgi:uncharacterized membrane protein YraQ (UPF0718 family)
MLKTATAKKRLVGLLLLAVMLGLFFSFNRLPKLDIVGEDLNAVTISQEQCFQGFCIDRDSSESFLGKWISFSVTYLRLVTVGMTFAFLVAGLAEAFLFSKGVGTTFQSGGVFKRTIQGAAIGPVMNLCSACIVPVSSAFRKRAGVEGAIALVQGSATMNIPALAMVFFVFTPALGVSRLLLSIVGALLIGPIVVKTIRQERGPTLDVPILTVDPDAPLEASDWPTVLRSGFREWAKASIGYLVRMAPIMVIAGFASGLAIQWLSPETVAEYLGNDWKGVLIAATFGILINVPLLFEIPLVALLLLMGMGTAPAGTLLFTAAAGGPVTFWGLAKLMPRRGIATFAGATWALGAFGGLVILAGGALFWEGGGLTDRVAAAAQAPATAHQPETSFFANDEAIASPDLSGLPTEDAFRPFINIASTLGSLAMIENRYPGVALFDYDRDGDLDFYVTSAEINAPIQVARGGPNRLFRNDGNGQFTEVAVEAGVGAESQNSTAVAACDFNNDGYQDLYVGAQGRIGDRLDYRSVNASVGLIDVISDRLYLNMRNGTFEDITASAFGRAQNIRSAASVACGDVDNDGWIDLYVGNRADQDFVRFDDARHHGHFNILYRNNGDLTFEDLTVDSNLLSPSITMRDFDGSSITFPDPSGTAIEGFDASFVDAQGNIVGDPAGQTWATMFFDHDDDGDLDLWVGDDGDRLKVYRNDSTLGNIRFTSIASAMGIDYSGQWMGFALGDYDRDADLDVFVTNMGYHLLDRPQPIPPGGDCAYSQQLGWGSCYHFLLENGGTKEVEGLGTVGSFNDVAARTGVVPSGILPPDLSNLDSLWKTPTGLAAYDIGFGTVFFDMENDGDQDLYWLGSLVARGEGPGGDFAPGFGRMLQNVGPGEFKDVTVEARLLDALGVDYSLLDPSDPSFDRFARRIGPEFHENGKGLAKGDVNGDGFTDLIGTNSNGETLDASGDRVMASGPLFVWLNGGGANHWITLRLKGRMAVDGTGSNADAIGARVTLTAAGFDGEPMTQVQEVLGSSSFLSMSSLDLNFGLGAATTIASITIRWPNGGVQQIAGLELNRVHEIIEPIP